VRSDPDPITVEIVRNALIACSLEMKADLRRTAYNPIINEMNDFSVGIFDARAQTLAQAQGLPSFVCDIPSAINAILRDIGGFDRFVPGDVYLTNDPHASTVHVHDVNAIRPVFYGERLVGFAGARAHWHDIGGASASGSMTATDVLQEGLVLRSVALYRAGELNEAVLRVIRANSRLPDTVLGDLRAQVAACDIGEQRLLELIQRFGWTTFDGCCRQILSDGEKQARAALERIPMGVYEAESGLDHDGVDRGVPLRIKAVVTNNGAGLHVDLSESTATCKGPVSSNFFTTRSICRLIFKCLTTPNEPANEGHFRMVELSVPEESIFNAHWPKSTMAGFIALHTLEDVLKRALATGMPDRVNADEYGKCTPAHIKFRSGDKYAILADTEGGGWGAKPFEDGENALLFGELRVIPVEVLESRYPVRVRKYTLRPDSGGAGQYRGGLGVVKQYECLDDAQLNAGFDRQLHPPQGLLGGKPAVPNGVRILRNDGSTEQLPSKVTDIEVRRGEVISFETAGGGGYGDPLLRELQLIESDMRDGYVSDASRLEEYGVVLVGDRAHDAAMAIDTQATMHRRSQLLGVLR
jgi:N-methylhydantoinase B